MEAFLLFPCVVGLLTFCASILLGYDAEASNVDTITMSDNPLLPSFFNGDTKFDPPLALLE